MQQDSTSYILKLIGNGGSVDLYLEALTANRAYSLNAWAKFMFVFYVLWNWNKFSCPSQAQITLSE